MKTGENNYVSYTYDAENVSSFILRDFGVRPENPLVEFFKDGKRNLYFVRIIAIIPSGIEKITIVPPEARNKVKTHAGIIQARTISIQWEEDIPPNAASTFQLWSIDIQYDILNEDDDDTAIHVVFEYDMKPYGNGNIGKKLSRGTVTTSVPPPASGSGSGSGS
ncbi:hypothetical protein [uncultured Kordia sp.]|uniref:hypothetical protein n=1 Tax=uncultured Kordia sp. TaxID=507699 RepID=UPI002630BEA8|nr:hypothetical protein [uncultured Kordia sp.]